jgi:hypothetical protein
LQFTCFFKQLYDCMYRYMRREIIVRGQSYWWLASSKILTPHRPASVYPLLLVRVEDTLAGWRGGWGVNILEDVRHSSVLYVCKYFVSSCSIILNTRKERLDNWFSWLFFVFHFWVR